MERVIANFRFMTQPLLTVKDLSVSFVADGRNITAVKNISFDIAAGEILAIVGESGSGKSVTSLALMQLLPKQAAITGQILFSKNNQLPENIISLKEKAMMAIRGKDIAMIFQEPMTSLNPVFTCGQQVSEVIELHQKVTRQIALQKTFALFEKVQLPCPAEIIDRYPHQLSGGQMQRVMIAMAMSCSPSLLIADEPTTALDVTVQKTILELIKELQQQNGMAVIFITHDLALVADIADKVIVMYKGQIIESGTTENILKHPRHPYTKALMECRPGLHPKGKRLPVVGDFLNGEWAVGDTNGAEISDQEITNVEASSKYDRSTIVNPEPPITGKNPVLQVEHLSVYYPGKKIMFGKIPEPFKAVNDVSFVVHKGETVGLVGESGCGKTTLGRAILQLIPATAGSIILNGTNLAARSKKNMRPLRKDLQIVFQDPYGSLNPRLTIGNAMLEPMKVHSLLPDNNTRKDKVIELLEKVNLDASHFNRYPHQFSGGQRQRICIARALVLNPSFLIFDESVSALDVSVQAQVLNLLNDLKKEFGFTAIFISHDLSIVRYISDRIIVMNKGKIVEEGLADDIYYSPRNEYTQKLINAIPGKRLINQ